MTNLQEFIDSTIQTKKEIIKVPTIASKAVMARKALNKILAVHPEWFNLISALVSYPIQKWAIATREELKIDTKSIESILYSEESTYFGIKSERSLKTQCNLNIQTNKIVCYLECSMNELCLQDPKCIILLNIHGTKQENVTNQMFNSTYSNAVIKFCEKYNAKFDELYKSIEKDFDSMEDDCQYAYNNIELLLKLKCYVANNYSKAINLSHTVKQLNNCINKLDTFNITTNNVEDVKKTIMLYSEGYTEKKICNELNRSRGYIRQKKKEGVKLLSYLIFGYSTKNIINNVN